MLHPLPQRVMEVWLGMAHKRQTAIIILTTKWLVRRNLGLPAGTWATTPPSRPGTSRQRPHTAPHPPSIPQFKAPLSLTPKHHSRTPSPPVVQGQTS